ncbi:hypothetical protein [Paenibacillus jiagnxiensis]|uniref:hypothetical protein n=1 Tax=Paenibacillus jiagnxiensis TaxID=3228926 RepID=UPI0033B3402A
MEWVKEVSKEYVYSRFNSCSDQDGEIELLKSKEKTGTNNITTLAQFYLAMAIHHPEGTYSSIPIANTYSYEKIKIELSPHYKKVQVVYVNKIPQFIIFQSARNESIEQIKQLAQINKINPIIEDLFLKQPEKHAISSPSTRYYLIKKSYIQDVDNPDFEPVWNFLQMSYGRERGVSLVPNGWKFYDGLLTSKAIGFIANRCYELVFAVDISTNAVIGLDIFFDIFE